MRRLFSDATAKSTPWSSRNDGYSRDRPASAMASPASAIWRTKKTPISPPAALAHAYHNR